LCPSWRPVQSLKSPIVDILAIINAKKREAPAQARNFAGARQTAVQMAWAIDQRVYGIKISPCDGLKPSKIIGRKKSGKRILQRG